MERGECDCVFARRQIPRPRMRGEDGLHLGGGDRQVGRQISGHAAAVHAIAFSPDGKTLASGGSELTVPIWAVLVCL